jgi:hypothetical protein
MCKTGGKTFPFEIFFCGFEDFIKDFSDNKDWRIYQVGFLLWFGWRGDRWDE